jgi:hypothetical protein
MTKNSASAVNLSASVISLSADHSAVDPPLSAELPKLTVFLLESSDFVVYRIDSFTVLGVCALKFVDFTPAIKIADEPSEFKKLKDMIVRKFCPVIKY